MSTGITLSDFLEMSFPGTLISEIVEVLGAEKTSELLAVFGGIPLNLPSKEELRIAIRDFNIYLAGDGTPARTLGKQVGISRQRVSQILREITSRVEAYKKLKSEGKLRTPVFSGGILDEVREFANLLDDGE